MLTSVRAQNAQGRMGALAPLVLGQAGLCGLLPGGIGLQLQDQLPELGSGPRTSWFLIGLQTVHTECYPYSLEAGREPHHGLERETIPQ